MEIVLFDNGLGKDLFPFALTRHVADIRIGILTIREKWEALLKRQVRIEDHLQPSQLNVKTIPANLVPNYEFFSSPEFNEQTWQLDLNDEHFKLVQFPWHLHQYNDWAIRKDFELVTHNRVSAAIPESVHVNKPSKIFIEEGARVSHCILNASTGPIYIGKNAEIMEGALIRGPFALCEGAVVKMGAKIYGATTIGPYSVVGGEIKNSILFGYSNKAHDGYLGDAVIAEWCNLGAGTSNSNLKNNAGPVKVWNPFSQTWGTAGNKSGLFMGDYSRSAINTSFNTGTVVGICANVFEGGLTPSYIPSFCWGNSGKVKYEFERAIIDITNWKKLKGKNLSGEEIEQLRNIFNQS